MEAAVKAVDSAVYNLFFNPSKEIKCEGNEIVDPNLSDEWYLLLRFPLLKRFLVDQFIEIANKKFLSKEEIASALRKLCINMKKCNVFHIEEEEELIYKLVGYQFPQVTALVLASPNDSLTFEIKLVFLLFSLKKTLVDITTNPDNTSHTWLFDVLVKLNEDIMEMLVNKAEHQAEEKEIISFKVWICLIEQLTEFQLQLSLKNKPLDNLLSVLMSENCREFVQKDSIGVAPFDTFSQVHVTSMPCMISMPDLHHLSTNFFEQCSIKNSLWQRLWRKQLMRHEGVSCIPLNQVIIDSCKADIISIVTIKNCKANGSCGLSFLLYLSQSLGERRVTLYEFVLAFRQVDHSQLPSSSISARTTRKRPRSETFSSRFSTVSSSYVIHLFDAFLTEKSTSPTALNDLSLLTIAQLAMILETIFISLTTGRVKEKKLRSCHKHWNWILLRRKGVNTIAHISWWHQAVEIVRFLFKSKEKSSIFLNEFASYIVDSIRQLVLCSHTGLSTSSYNKELCPLLEEIFSKLHSMQVAHLLCQVFSYQSKLRVPESGQNMTTIWCSDRIRMNFHVGIRSVLFPSVQKILKDKSSLEKLVPQMVLYIRSHRFPQKSDQIGAGENTKATSRLASIDMSVLIRFLSAWSNFKQLSTGSTTEVLLVQQKDLLIDILNCFEKDSALKLQLESKETLEFLQHFLTICISQKNHLNNRKKRSMEVVLDERMQQLISIIKTILNQFQLQDEDTTTVSCPTIISHADELVAQFLHIIQRQKDNDQLAKKSLKQLFEVKGKMKIAPWHHLYDSLHRWRWLSSRDAPSNSVGNRHQRVVGKIFNKQWTLLWNKLVMWLPEIHLAEQQEEAFNELKTMLTRVDVSLMDQIRKYAFATDETNSSSISASALNIPSTRSTRSIVIRETLDYMTAGTSTSLIRLDVAIHRFVECGEASVHNIDNDILRVPCLPDLAHLSRVLADIVIQCHDSNGVERMIKLLDRFSDWILFQPFVRRLYQGIELEWLRKVPLSLPLLRHVMNAIQVMEDFLMKQEGFSTNMNHIWSDHRFFLSEKLLVNWMTLGMLSDISLSDEQRMGMHIVEKFIGLLEKAIADGETKDQIQCFSHAYGLNMLVNTLASSFVFQRRERQNLKNRLDAISHFLAKALILDTNNRDSCGEVGMRYDALAVESQTDGVWIRTQRLQVVDRKVVLLGEMIESSVGASSECEVRLQPTFAQAVDSFMHTMIVEENEDQRVDEFWSMIWRYLDWEFAGDIGLLCQALLLKSAQHDRARRMIRSILSDLLVQVQTNQHGSPLWKWLFGCMRTYESMTSASRPNHWNLWWKIMCDMDLLTAIKISLSTSTWSVVDLDVLQTHIVYSMSHVHLTADPSGNISGYVLEFCMELAVLSMSKIGRSHRMEDPFIEKICSQFESEVELVTSSWNHLNKMDHLLQKWLKTLKHVQVRWKKSIISKKLFDKIISSLSGTMSKMSKMSRIE